MVAKLFEAFGLEGAQGLAWTAKEEFKDIRTTVVTRLATSLGKSRCITILIAIDMLIIAHQSSHPATQRLISTTSTSSTGQ